MNSELEAAKTLLTLSNPLQYVKIGTRVNVMYVIGKDARKKKWFSGIVKKTQKYSKNVTKVCVYFESDKSLVKDLYLHLELYDRQKEAGWTL